MTRPAKAWDETFRKDVERVLPLSPLTEPFDLSPAERVVDPKLYHESLIADIRNGPTGPRWRTGGLRTDIANYLKARGL